MVLEDDRYVPSDLSGETSGYVVGSDGMNGCDYLYTTIFDMFAWDGALREEKVLTREEQRIMYTPGRLNNNDAAGEDGYAFGWGVKHDEEGDELTFRLYPIGENEFGRKGGMLDLKFGEGSLSFNDVTCKKL